MVSMIKHLIIPSYSFNYSQLQPHLILTNPIFTSFIWGSRGDDNSSVGRKKSGTRLRPRF